MQPKASSSEVGPASQLIQCFVVRAGLGTATPEETMRALVGRLRRKCRKAGSPNQQLQFFVNCRGIRSIEMVRDLPCDGMLEPIGADYSAGFKILLNGQVNNERRRFTVSHEVCHTFFYELVPECKFSPHEVDPTEERLCNLGAAELLMPTASIQRAARPLAICLESLHELAEEYSVSLTAMFLRLRSLRLWKCELSEWHRMTNGTFALERLYGGKSRPWEWEDESILGAAWLSGKARFGHTYVKYKDQHGMRYYKPTLFEVRRFGERVLALWGADIERPSRMYPLFETGLSPVRGRRRSG